MMTWKKTVGLPISVSLNMPKVFERLMYCQIENFIKNELSQLLTVFRRIATLNTLINLLQKGKERYVSICIGRINVSITELQINYKKQGGHSN